MNGDIVSELRKEVNGWSRRAEDEERSDIEVVSDFGPLARFWYFEEPPKVLKSINLKNEERILDAGCGSGRYLTRFANLKASVVGVDASSSMLRRAKAKTRKTPNTFLVRADIMNLPFKSSVFDALISISVLQHLPSKRNLISNEKPCKSAIKELGRVIKTRGRIVISFANLCNPNSLLHLLVKLFLKKVYNKEIFMYYMTTFKAKILFQDQGLKVNEVVARGFYFPFRVGNIYLVPRGFIFRYLTLFEPTSSLINNHLTFLKKFGHSFFIEALKTTN